MSASVTISAASEKRIVYHRAGCIYAGRIKDKNKMTIPLKEAVRKGEYRQCKYCGGLAGDLRTRGNQVYAWENNLSVDISYIKNKNRLFIRTENGFWKIVPDDSSWTYRLFHLNQFSEKTTAEEMMRGDFHRQRDVKETHSLDRLVKYIHEHDAAKKIIEEDYRKLPQRTKNRESTTNRQSAEHASSPGDGLTRSLIR